MILVQTYGVSPSIHQSGHRGVGLPQDSGRRRTPGHVDRLLNYEAFKQSPLLHLLR